MARANSSRRIRAEDFLVQTDDRPGWVYATKRIPDVGEDAFCAGGPGRIVSVHGKTGDGSRLLEIELEAEKTGPFFAAASNVLVAPRRPKRARTRKKVG